ncbi:hypothetical protein YC2023_013450 [Brassica napus]
MIQGLEINKIRDLLPLVIRFSIENIVDLFPIALYGEEGPTGPKEKDNWEGDELFSPKSFLPVIAHSPNNSDTQQSTPCGFEKDQTHSCYSEMGLLLTYKTIMVLMLRKREVQPTDRSFLRICKWALKHRRISAWSVQRHHEVVLSGRVRTRNLGAGRNPSLPLDNDVAQVRGSPPSCRGLVTVISDSETLYLHARGSNSTMGSLCLQKLLQKQWVFVTDRWIHSTFTLSVLSYMVWQVKDSAA